jgi:hypothetical protein
MKSHPLSGCAASPSLASREGDGTLGAGRPFLGASSLRQASFWLIAMAH